ncbi:hypothetical protein BDP27DRAFT_1406111 [Rhodocollybia butyracea]|uniref:Uncharacterized protein n=1 Tax=Rhodocollybia butyracea TaxID=206335 RepID=A0A9P5PIJ2_9AGAR|nr:hypothetical protein BDP27DRAFT_1406111 [Rhodocollybia butyracea]
MDSKKVSSGDGPRFYAGCEHACSDEVERLSMRVWQFGEPLGRSNLDEHERGLMFFRPDKSFRRNFSNVAASEASPKFPVPVDDKPKLPIFFEGPSMTCSLHDLDDEIRRHQGKPLPVAERTPTTAVNIHDLTSFGSGIANPYAPMSPCRRKQILICSPLPIHVHLHVRSPIRIPALTQPQRIHPLLRQQAPQHFHVPSYLQRVRQREHIRYYGVAAVTAHEKGKETEKFINALEWRKGMGTMKRTSGWKCKEGSAACGDHAVPPQRSLAEGEEAQVDVEAMGWEALGSKSALNTSLSSQIPASYSTGNKLRLSRQILPPRFIP